VSGALDPARVFDSIAERYDRAFETPGLAGERLRKRLAAAADLLGDGPGAVLDVGMGPGRLLEELARRGWTVWGIDASPRMVALAKARLPAASERLVEGRLERISFADATFDAVAATGLLGWVGDLPTGVAELARVLRPGGRAVVAVPNARSPVTQWRHRVYWPLLATLRGTPRPDRRPAPARRFARAVADAGLAIETVAYAAGSVVPPPLDRAFPHTTLRLAAWAERRGPFLLSLLTNQRLVLARKTADPRPGDAAPPGSRFP